MLDSVTIVSHVDAARAIAEIAAAGRALGCDPAAETPRPGFDYAALAALAASPDLDPAEQVLIGWELAKAAGVSTAELLGSAGGPEDLDGLLVTFGRDPGWLPQVQPGFERLFPLFADRPGIELPDGTRRGFGAGGLRVNGSIFASPHRGRVMLKLGAAEVDLLLAEDLGRPFGKPGQRAYRDWILVPADGALAARAERSLAVVRSGSG